jgi:large subunit ribosomal protein L19
MKNNMTSLIKSIESDYLKTSLPELRVGYLIQVDVAIQEGNKKRIQSYIGVLKKYSKAGLNSTITVSRYSKGIRVTRLFPIHSPDITQIKIVEKP